MQSVPVLLPYPLPGAFDYEVPDGMAVTPGDFLVVPLNTTETVGVAWGASRPWTGKPLKPITQRLDLPPMTAELRKLVDWEAAYYMAPPGAVLAMALRIDLRAEPGVRVIYRAVPDVAVKLTPSRTRLLGILGDRALPAADLARLAGVGAPVVTTLAALGALEPIAAPLFDFPDPEHPGPILSEQQRIAAGQLRAAVARREFSVTLLQGVTGSGKTETYFEAIAETLRQRRQTLVLLPEIALSAQWLGRFKRRFGVEPAVWHSDLTPARRRDTWHAVANNEAPILVGARSALFLPFPDLGLIVVDEEHETSFKQEEGVIYHARDAAVVRARLTGAPIVLVSATPSLETVMNVEWGRYRKLDLPHRHGGVSMPAVATVDLRAHPPERGMFLAQPVIDAVRATLTRGEQAMLFLNRRGYAPLTLCRHCGHRMQCKYCSAWLVEHRGRRSLICHYCGHTAPRPARCPACDAEDSLAAIGPGVERIAEEAAALFPEARRQVMASDTINTPQDAARAVAAIENRQIDLIVGTQMVAKGWHFPHLTLVCVVDADLGLAGGDLRAGERTLQLLHQVAGRAGRAEMPGKVLLQTYNPEHPVMLALIASDFAGFMACEAGLRQPGHWPPFGRLAAVIVSSEQEFDADKVAGALGRAAPRGPGYEVLGPAPAPLALLRGRHRRRLLLKTTRDIAVQKLLREWLASVPVPRGVRVDIDIDPVSFF